MPDTRPAITHKFHIGAHEGYIIVGMYPVDLRPGEIFIVMNKQGSSISGLLDLLAIQISQSLQHGVPLDMIASKMRDMRFDPSGFCGRPDLYPEQKGGSEAKSIGDYIGRWLESIFANNSERAREIINILEWQDKTVSVDLADGDSTTVSSVITTKAGEIVHVDPLPPREQTKDKLLLESVVEDSPLVNDFPKVVDLDRDTLCVKRIESGHYKMEGDLDWSFNIKQGSGETALMQDLKVDDMFCLMRDDGNRLGVHFHDDLQVWFKLRDLPEQEGDLWELRLHPRTLRE